MPEAAAMACAAAIETANVALAPNLDLLTVPSKSMSAWSSADWLSAMDPTSALEISPLTCPTACITSSPPNRSPPSLNSSASRVPLDAPAGAMALPIAPSLSVTSASTVGRPRLSQTRLAKIDWMANGVMSSIPWPMLGQFLANGG